MNNVILTDVDGVILNYTSAFASYLEKHGYKEFADLVRAKGAHGQQVDGNQDFYQAKQAFKESEYYLNMNPYSDAEKIIPQLALRGYKFIAITAVNGKPLTKRMRKQNLTEKFPDIFSNSNIKITGEDKTPELKKHKNAVCWIDDRVMNIKQGVKLGLPCFYVDRSNSKLSVPRGSVLVKDWYQINELLKENE